MALIGAFPTATIPSKIPPKISTTPCHAFDQFPVNTPVTKSINPLKIRFPALKKLLKFATIPPKTLLINPPTKLNISTATSDTPLKKAFTPS